MHPIYSSTNQSFYRPPHEALGELYKIWEFKSDRFHESTAALFLDTSVQALDVALNAVPDNYKNKVRPILIELQQVSALQIQHFKNGGLYRELKE